ncbi:hypothetical protein [Francisella tularensis]|nr:hypothetical protein [Francisella tularensis]ABO47129.1 hypothetical protein FTW_1374 [Francisella tularensis subsp. tularensis WY96-3418]ADA78757.1 hypothetical protein NE061598_06170 [Francisella tularensis subsp. tularensis NE061598]AKE20202.1 hypothetical protein RO31_1242 [Francisella tularensis subsp. tularensis str. SCHU S4 substr. NR-28534]EKM85969.1 hypothetical protein B344_06849 [Francisella tularensis subsp. tularensis 831]EKM86036.1 hypothetical protein B345_06882 [Francisella 
MFLEVKKTDFSSGYVSAIGVDMSRFCGFVRVLEVAIDSSYCRYG